MKSFKKIYLAIICITAILITTPATAQTMFQGDAGSDIEEMAQESVEMWSDELGLTAKQEALMKDKIIEFAIKRQEVLQSKMKEEAKKASVLALQTEEHQEMRDILTKRQYERYLVLQEQRIDNGEEDNKKNL